LRNLLCYYPFFSPKKEEEIHLPFGPLESTLSYRVEPIELTPPYLGSPLMAYGLVPKTAKANPLLLFKGTTYPADSGFYLSLLTDINPFGAVGSFAFQGFGKEKFKSWLAKQAQDNLKAEVMGASLGGSLSLQTAATFPEYISSVHAFNSPGVTFKEVESWKKSQERPEVNVYLQEGDPVSSFVGRCFAPDWNIYRVFVPKITPAQVHASTYTAHPEVFIIPEEASTVNKDMRRRFWPFIQNVVLFPTFLLGSVFLVMKIQGLHIRSVSQKIFKKKASSA
jgi:pimeloyl-ACP methyl ester carboxylesterase